ncbi:hypothetical protein D9C73_021422 [Collichthys lucidus]|uniref:Uncharacterized protein n=1 Tax=Collichthys lucidus TaxID=240159 RepID=A0A4U5VGP8_COLLU|nr:hypothetical protein D9C73_021422 [Collichthys lucidus]
MAHLCTPSPPSPPHFYSPTPPPTSAHSGLWFLETGYQEPEALVSLRSKVSEGTESKGLHVHLAASRFDYRGDKMARADMCCSQFFPDCGVFDVAGFRRSCQDSRLEPTDDTW